MKLFGQNAGLALAALLVFSSSLSGCDSTPYYYFPGSSPSHRARTIEIIPDPPPEGVLAYFDFNGNAGDRSGNEHHGQMYGPEFVHDRFGLVESAVHFNGVDDYIDLLDSDALKVDLPITLSAWVKLDQNQATMAALTTDFSFQLNTGVFMAFDSNGANPSISIGSGAVFGSHSRRTRHSEFPLETGVWYHVVGVVESAAEMYVYVNGVDVSGRMTGAANGLIYSRGPASMGRRTATTGYPPIFFEGSLDEVAIFAQALTPDEVIELFMSGTIRGKNTEIVPES